MLQIDSVKVTFYQIFHILVLLVYSQGKIHSAWLGLVVLCVAFVGILEKNTLNSVISL